MSFGHISSFSILSIHFIQKEKDNKCSFLLKHFETMSFICYTMYSKLFFSYMITPCISTKGV